MTHVLSQERLFPFNLSLFFACLLVCVCVCVCACVCASSGKEQVINANTAAPSIQWWLSVAKKFDFFRVSTQG